MTTARVSVNVMKGGVKQVNTKRLLERKKIRKRTRSTRVNIIHIAKSYNYDNSHNYLSVLGWTRNNP